MKAILVILALVAVALSVRIDDTMKIRKPIITKDLVEAVNAHGKWKADLNKGSIVDGITLEQAKALMGAKKGSFLPYFILHNILICGIR